MLAKEILICFQIPVTSPRPHQSQAHKLAHVPWRRSQDARVDYVTSGRAALLRTGVALNLNYGNLILDSCSHSLGRRITANIATTATTTTSQSSFLPSNLGIQTLSYPPSATLEPECKNRLESDNHREDMRDGSCSKQTHKAVGKPTNHIFGSRQDESQ